ncbi:hypothetical protein P7C73_g4166, partial [Tremellales sp. Uapishka_1]
MLIWLITLVYDKVRVRRLMRDKVARTANTTTRDQAGFDAGVWNGPPVSPFTTAREKIEVSSPSKGKEKEEGVAKLRRGSGEGYTRLKRKLIMAPLFSTRSQDKSKPSTMKSFSNFMQSSFNNSTTAAAPASERSPPPIHVRTSQVIPSHSAPYRPSSAMETYTPMQDLSETPLGVYIHDDGLPQTAQYDADPLGALSISGLPSQKQLPTLASAIHIQSTNPSPAPPQPEPTTTRKRSDSKSRRPMSRRLSFDNILPLFSGSIRKKEKEPQDPIRWASPPDKSTSSIHSDQPARPATMVLPSIRTLRSKFVVGGTIGRGNMMANAKAEVAARQREKKAGEQVKHVIPRIPAPLPPKSGDRRGFQGGSLGRAMGRSLRTASIGQQPEAVTKWNLDQPDRPASALGASLGYRKPSQISPKTVANDFPPPVLAPNPSARSSSFDFPSPLPPVTRAAHTPILAANGLPVPQTAARSLFSPAQDDASIVDPQRSPFAGAFSPHSRQQSMTELKDAFSRMQDLAGSLPVSRKVSETANPLPAQKEQSLDLESLDEGLKALMRQAQKNAAHSVSTHSSIEMDIEGMSRAHSGRSWTTAKEDLPTFPRSRSKSTNNLASLCLVDEMEKQQGEGWWSKQSKEDDERIALLERLAKSSILPSRAKFGESSPYGTPPRRRVPGGEGNRTLRTTSLLSSVPMPRERQSYHGHAPRPSLVTQTTWTPSSRRRVVSAIEAIAETPSRRAKGPFVSDKISPSIVERVSWMSTRPKEDAAASPKRMMSVVDKLKEKHALELDALLSALSSAKNDNRALNDEVGGLHRLLAEGLGEREKLRERVKDLEDKVACPISDSTALNVHHLDAAALSSARGIVSIGSRT